MKCDRVCSYHEMDWNSRSRFADEKRIVHAVLPTYSTMQHESSNSERIDVSDLR
jgi:hypothetical protein